jgi:serine/threonine protein kinase
MQLNGMVAVKVVNMQRASDLRGAERELSAALRLMPTQPFCNRLVLAHDCIVEPPYAGLVEHIVTGNTLEAAMASTLKADDAWRVFGQLLCALCHCHAHGLAHLDVKGANVLLAVDQATTTPDAYLCDFGLASFEALGTGVQGTFGYMAPEVMAHAWQPTRVGKQFSTMTADIWALGALLHKMLLGRLPYGSDDVLVLANEQNMGCKAALKMASNNATVAPWWSYLPAATAFPDDATCCLLDAMLHTDPGKRPTAAWVANTAAPLLPACAVTPKPGHLQHIIDQDHLEAGLGLVQESLSLVCGCR